MLWYSTASAILAGISFITEKSPGGRVLCMARRFIQDNAVHTGPLQRATNEPKMCSILKGDLLDILQFWIPQKKLSKSKRNKLLKIYQIIIEQRKKIIQAEYFGSYKYEKQREKICRICIETFLLIRSFSAVRLEARSVNCASCDEMFTFSLEFSNRTQHLC
jgi:hypothetical protein